MKYTNRDKNMVNTIILCVLTMFLCLYIGDDVLGLNQPPAQRHIQILANVIFWGSLVGLPFVFRNRIPWKFTWFNLPLYFLLFFPLYELCGLKHSHCFLQSGGFFEFPSYWNAALIAVLFWGVQSIVFFILYIIRRIKGTKQ